MNRSRNIRSRPAGFAKQSRHKKALFLPMDRAAADDLVLPVRIAYERIRMGKCDRGAVVYMAEIVLLVGFLTEGGFGQLAPGYLSEVEERLLTELDERREATEWEPHVDLVDALGVVVNEYDRLVRETRLHAILEANESFWRLTTASQAVNRA